MQLPIRVFAALFLAHLLGDFPLQPPRLRLAKRRHWWASALHGLIHGALLLICLVYFAVPFEVFHWRVFLWASCYIALHLLIDVAKGRFPEDSIAAFSIDQTLHLATVFGLALLLTQLQWRSLHSLLVGRRLHKRPSLIWCHRIYNGHFCGWVPDPVFDQRIGSSDSIRCGGTAGADEECGTLYRMVGAAVGRLRRHSPLSGTDGPDSDWEIDCPFPRDERTKVCRVFSDWNPAQPGNCSFRRAATVETVEWRGVFPAVIPFPNQDGATCPSPFVPEVLK